jgi:hypothetical protein
MFKTELDGLYHREQINYYIREAAAAQRCPHARGGAGRKVALALLWSLPNLGQVATLLHLFK